MILIEKTEIMGWEPAIRGMRNPMTSWARSDSRFRGEDGDYYNLSGDTWPEAHDDKAFYLGSNDHDVMMRLAKAGSVDGNFRRMITVYVDLTAPLYWWNDFDTYIVSGTCKAGTVTKPCSIVDKINTEEFTLEDFSHEHLTEQSLDILRHTIQYLNMHRTAYLTTTNEPMANSTALSPEACDKLKKDILWQMIQLLPSSYNQARTVMLNYEILSDMYQHQQNDNLDEWRKLCRWIESLPYSEIITCNAVKESFTYKELYEKFIAANPSVEVSDYRPYPFCDNSIIVWVSKLSNMPLTIHREIAFHYDPQKDVFTTIEGAKSYDEILNSEKRTS